MIDEKKLIEELNGLATSNEMMGYLTAFDVVQDCIGIVEKQPQIEKCADCTRRKFYQQGYQDGLNADKWIPCEERLPKEATTYLVTEEVIICSQKQYVVDVRLFGTENEWLCPSNRKIIAWQPLPQPYKKEGEE